MPKIAWNTTAGSLSGPWCTTREGWKQVPFDPKVKPPSAYYSRRWTISDAELGSFGIPCGTSFWGENAPDLLCTSSKDATVIYFTPLGQQAYNRAYGKFKDKAYTQAANLTAIVEMGKTVSMIESRMFQLLKGAQHLRRGEFKKFTETFNVRPLKKHENKVWSRPREFAGLWLEYWMGWAPTVGDVITSITALTEKPPPATIRAGNRVPLDAFQKTTSGNSIATSQVAGYGNVWVTGCVDVTNPNLHMANKLGLINVPKTLWETATMSFLADWFLNVGQVLGQFTDWVGLQLTNIVVSVKTNATISWLLTGAKGIFGAAYPNVMYHKKGHLRFIRYVLPGLPLVKPTIGLPNKLSLSRAATSASLLVSIFAPKRA